MYLAAGGIVGRNRRKPSHLAVQLIHAGFRAESAQGLHLVRLPDHRRLKPWKAYLPEISPESLDAQFPAVYAELRRLAAGYLNGERPDHTLQPTALVHEAYMRLATQHGVNWQNRAQFFGVAAAMMRRILVNHAHAHAAAKRGGGVARVTLDESLSWDGGRDVDLVALDEALTRLAALDPRQARVVELRFFAGLSLDETAEALDISVATVKREWSMAKAWLRRELAP